MKKTISKEELSSYIDTEMDQYKENHLYWFKGGENFKEGSENYEFFRTFIKDVSTYILEKTAAEIIIDASSQMNLFGFKFLINSYQIAEFSFRYDDIVDSYLYSHLGMSLKYEPFQDRNHKDLFRFQDNKEIPTTFLRAAISPKIKKHKLADNSLDYLQIANCDDVLDMGSSFEDYNRNYPIVETMIKNNSQEFTNMFKHYFDRIYVSFKPVADSLERNFSRHNEIFEEKKKLDNNYKCSIKELSNKLFE